MKLYKKPNLNPSRVIRTKNKIVIKEPEYDFLKNFRLVRLFVRDNYNLGLPEMEMLLSLYGEGLFNYRKFEKYQDLYGWDSSKFASLKSEGWFAPFGRGEKNEIVYEVTKKTRVVCTRIYKMLLGLEIIPEDKEKNKSISQERWSARARFIATKEANQSNMERKITYREPDF